MEKRLNRSDLIFSLAFLLMLVIAVASFFYGVKVGSDRVEAKYAAPAEPEVAVTALPNGYQQQDLVSFYHTVFLPYREFQNEWFDAQREWLADGSVDPAAALNELSKTAKKTYEDVKVASVSQASPLLVEAQTSYLKSLKLFSDGFSELANKAGAQTADALLSNVNANAYYKEGRNQSLAGQGSYYGAMLKWASMVDTDLPSDFDSPDILSLSKWKTLPLIIKLKVASDYLSLQQEMPEFSPQDLTARIDDFIASGQAERRKLKSFSAIAELLTSTEGVRSGDFLKMKDRFYGNEQLPQLPFFFRDN
ncbi:hypothetical protein [Cohnella sp. GCM10027633]|uniref:hypothetical protein n=1 Tax=unclassified Cohnella TaxID=2636738 RepID=UPI003643B389